MWRACTHSTDPPPLTWRITSRGDAVVDSTTTDKPKSPVRAADALALSALAVAGAVTARRKPFALATSKFMASSTAARALRAASARSATANTRIKDLLMPWRPDGGMIAASRRRGVASLVVAVKPRGPSSSVVRSIVTYTQGSSSSAQGAKWAAADAGRALRRVSHGKKQDRRVGWFDRRRRSGVDRWLVKMTTGK